MGTAPLDITIFGRLDPTIIAGLIAVFGGLYTLYLNEKYKRTFHFIEKTWSTKYSLFEELISTTYKIHDHLISAFLVKKISVERDPFQAWKELVATVELIIDAERRIPLSEEDYKKLISMNKNQINSNLQFLEDIRLILIHYYANKAHILAEKPHEIRSKLNLIIMDTDITRNIQSIIESIYEEAKKLWEKTEFDIDSFSENNAKKLAM